LKKSLLVAVLLAGCAAVAFSQPHRMPVLGILPFVGGAGGDGEAIATLISMEPEILRAFTVVPRTAALNAIFEEHRFQLEGLTDSDTIAGIGRMLNADYVLSGHIRQLEDRNLVIATIVNVETFEQVGGYFRTYQTIEEVRDFLPSMARSMVGTALRQSLVRLPSLAMLPFTLAPGIDAQDAETLSKILAIEILNTGDYVVLPRTSTMQAALAEMDFQMLGYTDDAGMAALGRAINADLVLSAGVHRLGVLNMFTAQVLRVADGSLFAGASADYQVIADGIDLMAELAILLTDPNRIRVAIAVPADRMPSEQTRISLLEDPSRFWSLGVSGNFSTVELISGVPVAGVTVQGTLSPFRRSFIRVGSDFLFGRYSDDFYSTSIFPFVHYAFFLPFATIGGWHIGMGGGFMMTSFENWEGSGSDSFFAADLTTGFTVGWFSVSYTLRTNFSAFSDKISVGFVYRFRARGNR